VALKLIGEVALDGSGWQRGLSQMASSVKGFIATAFGIYGVQQALQKTFETASDLADASDRLGIGTEKLQIFKQAAKDAGSSLEAIVTGLEKVEIARSKALGGDKNALDAFAKVGVSPEMLKSMSREDLFSGPIANAVRTMNQADLAAPMKEIFSRAFGELIPVLQTDFESLGAKMRKAGAIMDTETIAALDLLADQFSILSNIIAAQLGPVLLTLVESLWKLYAGISATWAYIKVKAPHTMDLASASTAAGMSYGAVPPSLKPALNYSKDEVEALNKAAKEAALKQFTKVMDGLGSLKQQFADAAERLKNPPKAKFEADLPDEKAPKVKLAKGDSGDALTRVGNFLGSSRDVLTDVAFRQLNYLSQIAQHTNKLANNSSTSGSIFPPV
jgi:hypothetical protein